MPENEAIEIIKNFPKWNLDDQWLNEDEMQDLSEVAMLALEEIQQYRALGTVKELWETMEKRRAKKIIIVKARNEIEDVSIGDFVHYKCPNCRKRIGSAFHYPPNEYMMEYKFCDKCGQAIDWREEE